MDKIGKINEVLLQKKKEKEEAKRLQTQKESEIDDLQRMLDDAIAEEKNKNMMENQSSSTSIIDPSTKMRYVVTDLVCGIITCKAAVAWSANNVCLEEIEVSPPQKGEIRIKMLKAFLCRIDYLHLEGNSVRFPYILGHEGIGMVESIGLDVNDIAVGDYVITIPHGTYVDPNFHKTFPFGEVMDDGETRFTCNGHEIYHFCGLSTFSEYTVIRQVAVQKILKTDLEHLFPICSLSIGYDAPINTCVVTNGSTVGIFGMGILGYSVALACKAQGAAKIVGIDIDDERLMNGTKFGTTHNINNKNLNYNEIINYVQLNFGALFDFVFVTTTNLDQISQGVACTKVSGYTCLLGDKRTMIPLAEVCIGRNVRGCMLDEPRRACTAILSLIDNYFNGKLSCNLFNVSKSGLDQIKQTIERYKIYPHGFDTVVVIEIKKE